MYVPRYAFANMSQDTIMSLFQKHDTCVKSLKMIPLAPLITNIDTLRTEQFKNGEKRDRSTRQLAMSHKVPVSNTSVKCDVVNRGYDQKAYLLTTAIHHKFVSNKLATYQRESFLLNSKRNNSVPRLVHQQSFLSQTQKSKRT